MHADQRYVSVHNDLVGLYASEINTATQVVVEIRKTPRICVITPPRQAPTALSALRLDARSDDGDGRRVILSSDQIKGVEISNSNDQKADAFASIANFAPVKNLTTVQLGVPALRWTAGDDAANLQAMIEVSVVNLETDLPEIANARFDFSDGTFRDAKGGLIPYEAIDLWGNRLKGSGRAGGGHNTVKRGIVLSSLLRAASEKRPAILEQVLRQSRQMGQAVAGTFYMRRDSATLRDSLRAIVVAMDARRLSSLHQQAKGRGMGSIQRAPIAQGYGDQPPAWHSYSQAPGRFQGGC